MTMTAILYAAGARFLKSIDGGQTWSDLTSVFPAPGYRSPAWEIFVDPLDAGTWIPRIV
jgi:hypothetical protein